MNPKINAANVPLYDVSVSVNLIEHVEIWHKLLFINYSELNISEIMDICHKCHSYNLFTGVIYWYRNLTNDKLYIGKTVNPHDRHQTHLCSSKIGSNRKDAQLPIHRAIKKYGIENFEYRILCFVVDSDKKELNTTLNKKEQYYIKLYQSTDKQLGYNILDGGNSSPNPGLKIRQYTKFGEYIQTFESIAEATRQTGCKSISSAINRKQYYANGYIFVPVGIELPFDVFNKYKRLVIHQYSTDGKYLQTFDSAKDAAKSVHGDQSRIGLCAQPPCDNIAYGFRWSHEKVDQLQSEVAKLPVYVCQYNKKGEFVNEYENIALAAKSINCKHGGHISLCLKEQWRKAGGYYWRTFKTDKIDIPNEKISKTS